MKHKFFDNSRISSYRSCPREFYFRHVRHWAPENTKIWFTFGGAWHAAMDSMWSMAAESASEKDTIEDAYRCFVHEWVERGEKHPSKMSIEDLEDLAPRTPAIAREMLFAYYKARAPVLCHESFELLAVEQPFAVPLDPNDPTRQYVGRFDKVFRFEGRTKLGEHKTTTAYRKDGFFRSDFLDSFSPNSQIDGYQYAAKPLYLDLSSIWIDAALVHRTVHNGFKWIALDRGDTALDAFLWETHHWIDQIELNKAALAEEARTMGPYLAAFPRNTSNCGQCAFRDPCRALSNPHKQEKPPTGFKYEPWSPFSEIALEKIGFSPEEDRP